MKFSILNNEVDLKRTYVIIVAILILFVVSKGITQYLHTEGKKLVNGQGEEILLRGIGLGGWLVPEGYQLHIPGFGSPSAIREKIQELIGEQETGEFYSHYRENYVNKKDIEKIALWGFNSIRIPFNYRLLSPEDQPGMYLEQGFAVIDSLLNWCTQYQMYLILDMHCAPGGQNKDNISDSDGEEARLWTDEANQIRTIEIWKKIAERYKNEIWIGGYDIINEPVLPAGVPATDLRKFYMSVVQEIRKVDANHIVFIEGNWYATDFTSLTPPFDGNMVYSFHKYWNENTTSSIQSYLSLRNQYSVPLWLGESGENSNTWFHDCVQLMEKNNIGWCWWTHKKVATITSPYSAVIPSEYQRILDYWNGMSSRPSKEEAVAGFSALTENLKLENCEFHAGVLEALFNNDFGVYSKSFSSLKIPGVIPAEQYDFGSFGVSYNDSDYQNTNGPGSSSWNKGWTFRNDGVDIELSEDSDSSIYSVGWTESGEWILYTVDVTVSAEYEIEVRASSPGSLGKCKILLDNQEITDIISIPATGGWHNWQTFIADTVKISAGLHKLKFFIVHGGFNINFIRLKITDSVLNESDFKAVNSNVYLGLCYPNPFSTCVKIPVFITKPEDYSLKIYSINGEIVKEFSEIATEQTGLKLIQWDGTDQNSIAVSSGVYIYTIIASGHNKSMRMVLKR